MVDLLLQHNNQVDSLAVQPMDSKTCVTSSPGPSVYPHYQDLARGYAEDRDDVVSNSTCVSSASTMSSFYSDRSFYSDISRRSDLSLSSRSSSTPSSDAAGENAEHEQGYPSSESTANGSRIGAASGMMPRRHFRHARTRSGHWRADAAEMPPEAPPEETGCLPASRWRSSKIRFAFPLAEVALFEEEEEEEIVPEEPAPMVPMGNAEPVVMAPMLHEV